MSTHLVLDNTLGAGLIAIVVTATFNGVSLIQTWYYYTHQTDGRPLKYLVGVVVASDFTHQALVTHSMYWYTITSWGNLAALQLIVRSIVVECIFVGLNAFLVQSFLALRVWHLSGHNKFLTGIIAVVVLGQFVANTVSIILAFQVKTYALLAPLQWLDMFCNVLTATGDILITSALCILLHRLRTGFRRPDTMINKLIIFTVHTGLISSIFAVASLMSLIFARRTFFNMSFYWCICRSYTNSLLANLNARKSIGAIGRPNDDLSFISDFFKSSPGTQQPANLSMKVDAAREFTRNEQLDHASDVKNRELGSLSVDAC